MPSRYLCNVLDDMREMYKVRNFSGLLGSIEQAQIMASRMEAALDDKKTIEEYEETAAKLNRDLKAGRKEIRKLENEIRNLNHNKRELEAAIKQLNHIKKRLENDGELRQEEKEIISEIGLVHQEKENENRFLVVRGEDICNDCGQTRKECVCPLWIIK